MSEKVGSSVVPASSAQTTGGSHGGSGGIGWSRMTLAIAATAVLLGATAGFFLGQGSRRSDSQAKVDVFSAKVNVVKDARKAVADQKRELQGASRQRVNAAFGRGKDKGYAPGLSAGRAAAERTVADARSRGQADGNTEGFSRGLADYQAYDYVAPTPYCDPYIYYC